MTIFERRACRPCINSRAYLAGYHFAAGEALTPAAHGTVLTATTTPLSLIFSSRLFSTCRGLMGGSFVTREGVSK
jgi:hypothetical protein